MLAAVMTDKATVEIPSPVDGEVLWLGAEVGDTVAIGSPIVRLKVAGDGNVKEGMRRLRRRNRRPSSQGGGRNDRAQAAPKPGPEPKSEKAAPPTAKSCTSQPKAAESPSP